MPIQTPNTNSLESLVEMAAQRLLAGPTSSEPQDSVLFTGVWHDAYPAILVRDPILPDSSKIQLLYLMQEARAQPYGVTPLPSIEVTARDLGKSVPTVVRDRAILRMTRWISQCSRVRDAQGRFRGVVYALHGEPASLANATALDPEHMELLEKAAAGHFDRIARRVAHAVLAAIDADIHEGRDPLEPIDQMEQRMEAIQSIKAGNGRFFAGVIPERKSRLKDFKSVEPASNLETRGSDPVSNFETCGSEPSSKLEGGPKREGTESVYSVDTSSHPKKPRNVPKLEGGPESGGTAFDDYSVIASLPQHDSWVFHSEAGSEAMEAANAKPNFSPEHHKKPRNVLKLEAGTCSSCSSYFEKTTTGNEPESDTSPPLTWPTDFSDNLKRLVQRMLVSDPELPPAMHQPVVDALAVKMRDTSNPIRNFGGYVYEICRRAKAGSLNPVRTPTPPPSPSPRTDRTARINNLRSEIRTLEQLLKAASRTGTGRQALEAQLAQRRSQLRELEESIRH